mgnify:CR=1 FL=1
MEFCRPTRDEFCRLADQGNLIPVTRRLLADQETPLTAYRKIRGQGESFLFESVEGGEHLGRYSFVGCNPRGMILSRDKALTKKVLSYDGIKVPAFTTVPVGQLFSRPDHLRFPLIVKSLTQDASFGISQASVVNDDRKLTDRVAYINEGLGSTAIIEQYINGRELYVGVIGNQKLDTWCVSSGSVSCT